MIKKKKGFFSIPIFIIMLALSLIGCSEETSSDSEKKDNDNYPNKSIELVVPYSAGGGTDTVARAFSELSDFDESVVVSNIEGGGGSLGTNEVINADPDGHKILLH